MGSSQAPGWGDPRFREALLRRAEALRVDPRVRVRFDTDDLVSETLARAVAADAGDSPFRGTTDGERFAYLFQIQARVLHDAHDRDFAARRSVRREVREADLRAIDQALTDTLPGVAAVAAAGPSPSRAAIQKERLGWANAALDRLPGREREAMALRFREGLPLKEIARRMGATESAVGALIARATRRLRELKPDDTTGG
jgi:RNA polymerase sigma-70 factor (ECF subfamily)